MTVNDWPGLSGKGDVSRAGIETQDRKSVV